MDDHSGVADRLQDPPEDGYYDDGMEELFSRTVDAYRAFEDDGDDELARAAVDRIREYIRDEHPVVDAVLDVDPGTDLETAMQPAEDEEGYWMGAVSAASNDTSEYLAVRERAAEERGRAVIIHERDGDEYTPVTEITADEMGVVSIERPALLTDPETDLLKLYLPVELGENDWDIVRLDDVQEPTELDPDTSRTVIDQGDGPDSVTAKDPVIEPDGDRFHAFYSGHDGTSEQAQYAVSDDGADWEKGDTNPVLPRQHWHDHHTRVSSLIDLAGDGYAVLYEGSGTDDAKNTWNLRTGLGYIAELGMPIIDLSPDGPELSSPAADAETGLDGFGTLRYAELIDGDDATELLVEVARDTGAFDLRGTGL